MRATDITVADAANLYLERLCQRAEAGQISWGHYRGVRNQFRRLMPVLGADRPLSEIGRAELERAVLWFAKRPPCLARKFQKAPLGVPISKVTAKTFIAAMRALFLWVSDHDELLWERPRGFDRIFKLKDRALATPAEAAQELSRMVTGDVRTFNADVLSQLFRAGRSRDRLYVLLGLNCGFTSIDISSLRTFEVFLEEEAPFIHQRRHKTGVEAKWSLWPETVALLKRHRARANEENLWLLTRDGNPLVVNTRACRKDAVDQAWSAVWTRTTVRNWMGFRFLRKTGADAIKRIGGLEESEMYLAHQEPGLNKHYANRNWAKMWEALARYRERLPFLGLAWDLDPEECLFTQQENPAWADANPPYVQRVTKRSQTRLLNVSLHPDKGLYYARVYERGRTYSRGYFQRAEDAANAAREIRRLLACGLDPRVHLAKALPGQHNARTGPKCPVAVTPA